jgi:hypothetical protein
MGLIDGGDRDFSANCHIKSRSVDHLISLPVGVTASFPSGNLSTL